MNVVYVIIFSYTDDGYDGAFDQLCRDKDTGEYLVFGKRKDAVGYMNEKILVFQDSRLHEKFKVHEVWIR